MHYPLFHLWCLSCFPSTLWEVKCRYWCGSIDMTDNDRIDIGDVWVERASASESALARPASKLGVWYTKILWIGRVISLAERTQEFEAKLTEFCANYHAPLSIPSARRTYQTDSVEDLADLSIRFLGVGSERLKRTMERSIGLSPMVKKDGKMRHQRACRISVAFRGSTFNAYNPSSGLNANV